MTVDAAVSVVVGGGGGDCGGDGGSHAAPAESGCVVTVTQVMLTRNDRKPTHITHLPRSVSREFLTSMTIVSGSPTEA
jgi:hypothetical protein